MVQNVIERLNNHAVRCREDADLVKALTEQAQQIGAIVNTIDDIANQTPEFSTLDQRKRLA